MRVAEPVHSDRFLGVATQHFTGLVEEVLLGERAFALAPCTEMAIGLILYT